MRFQEGELSASDALALNDLWAKVDKLSRLSVVSPLSLTRPNGAPIISAPGLAAPGFWGVITAQVAGNSYNANYCLESITTYPDAMAGGVTAYEVNDLSNVTIGAKVRVFYDNIGTGWGFDFLALGGGGNATPAYLGNVTIGGANVTLANGTDSNVTFSYLDTATYSQDFPVGMHGLALKDVNGTIWMVPAIPATASYPGWVSNTTQIFGGSKEFAANVTVDGYAFALDGIQIGNEGSSPAISRVTSNQVFRIHSQLDFWTGNISGGSGPYVYINGGNATSANSTYQNDFTACSTLYGLATFVSLAANSCGTISSVNVLDSGGSHTYNGLYIGSVGGGAMPPSSIGNCPVIIGSAGLMMACGTGQPPAPGKTGTLFGNVKTIFGVATDLGNLTGNLTGSWVTGTAGHNLVTLLNNFGANITDSTTP